MYWTDAVLALVILILSLVLGRTVSRKLGVSHIPMWVMTAILLALGLLIHVEQSAFFIPSDAVEYRNWGYALAELYRSGTRAAVLDVRPEIWPGKGVWAVLISILAYLFGPIELTMVALSASLTSWALIFLQRAVGNRRNLSTDLLVFALFISTPALLVFGSGPLREAPFWLGVSAGVLGVTYAWGGEASKAVIFLGTGVLFLLAIRPDFGYVISLFLSCSAALGYAMASWQVSRFYSIAVGVLQSLHLGVAPMLYRALATPTTIVNLENLATTRRSLAGSQVTSRLQSIDQSPSEATSRSPSIDQSPSESELWLSYESILEALFGPWPNNVASTINALAIVATFQFFVVLGLAIAGFLLLPDRRNEIAITILLSTALLILLCIVLTNFGALMRFRANASLLLIPIAAGALPKLIARLRHVKAISVDSRPAI